jgi:hypothetical protein
MTHGTRGDVISIPIDGYVGVFNLQQLFYGTVAYDAKTEMLFTVQVPSPLKMLVGMSVVAKVTPMRVFAQAETTGTSVVPLSVR